MAEKPRPRGAVRRIGRAIGDAGLTIGIAGGLTHGRGGGPKTQLDARAALIDEGHGDYDSRSRAPGLLDGVPGWVVLLVAALILVAVLTLTSWQ